MGSNIRIDKWLWAVRLYKTRSLASEECQKGKVLVNGMPVKPSREIKIGDTLQIKRPPIIRSYMVLGLTDKRMSAPLTVDFIKDITPQEQLDILETQKHMSWFKRERGTGRPTKKERRDLDGLFENE